MVLWKLPPCDLEELGLTLKSSNGLPPLSAVDNAGRKAVALPTPSLGVEENSWTLRAGDLDNTVDYHE